MANVFLESQVAKALASPKEWKLLSTTEKNLYEGMARKVVLDLEKDISNVKDFVEKKLGEKLTPKSEPTPTYDDCGY